MPIKGSKDGLQGNSQLGKKTEPLVTVAKVKEIYLFGLDIRDKNADKELPDSAYQQYIDNAVSMLEHYLDISITPVTNYEEFQDYNRNDYMNYGYMSLNNYPVIQINSMEMVYFRDSDGEPEVAQEIPLSWIRLTSHDGIMRLLPNNRFPSKLQLDATGSFFPQIFNSSNAPHLWRINYDFGFCEGQIPVMLNNVIGQLAAIQALVVGGNLVLGAGIASSSISLDGLSESIATTQSAENSAYSATIKDYSDKLFGKRDGDPHALLTILRTFYKSSHELNLI